jgi:hypothetical protein
VTNLGHRRRALLVTWLAVVTAVVCLRCSSSTPTTPTGLTPGCSYTISPASRSARSAGANFAVRVTTTFGCKWGFSSSAGWIMVTPDTDGAPNGNGNGTVVAGVAPTADAAPRTGTATIAGQTLTVVQDGTQLPACRYGISETAASFLATGGNGRLLVTASPNACSWFAEVPDDPGSWLKIVSATRGSGDAVMEYTVSANNGQVARTGDLVLNGDSSAPRLVLTVTQAR